MSSVKIKIGHQQQAGKPIYLFHSGSVECGNFKYKGRYIERFKEIYRHIMGLNVSKVKNGVVDVSHCQYWNAVRIYHDYVEAKWLNTVSAGRLEKFAIETEVFLILEEIRK